MAGEDSAPDRERVADGGRDDPDSPPIAADLHAHTTISDGTLRLDEVPTVASAAGLEVVALTDHDRIHPELEAPVVDCEGLRLVRGIELRVDAGFERLDLLGYAVERTDALEREIERLQRDRIDRGRRIIENVEERLGVDLGIEPREGLGRPHVARAIADSDAPFDYRGAFENLIGDDGPCYVARDVTPLDRGVELLREACPVVGLAHPFRYENVDAALEVARELDAVERWYPYGDGVDADPRLVERLAEEADLLLTGGSDAHDRELGRCGLTAAAFEPVAARFPEPR